MIEEPLIMDLYFDRDYAITLINSTKINPLSNQVPGREEEVQEMRVWV
jgi:hypothetical protein